MPVLGPLSLALLGPSSEIGLRLLIGLAIASVPGVICAFVAFKRRESPRYGWAIGLALNAYGFLVLVTGLALVAGLVRFHI